jgi:uncharacterized RDD family membrane protein YckC
MTLQTFCPQCGAALAEGAQFCGSCGYRLSSDASPEAASEASDLNYQVVGRRIVAALIDFVPLVVAFLVIAATVGNLGENDRGEFRADVGTGGTFLLLLVGYAYYIAFEALTAATPGKMVMGLKVVKANGEPYSFGAVLGRNLLRIVDGLFFYVVAIIVIAVTKKRQRLGDLAAGTLVVAK